MWTIFKVSSPVAYWAPTDLESLYFSVISFCLFILFMWFSRQEYWIYYLSNFQFSLIHEPNIPGSCAILFFTASDFTSITSHIHNWALFLLWLGLFIPSGSFLCSSPVAYCAPTNLGSSSFSVISFCLFILFMGFSRQEYWSGLPFPSPVDHILSDLSTMIHPSRVAPQGLAYFHWVRQGCGPSVIR